MYEASAGRRGGWRGRPPRPRRLRPGCRPRRRPASSSRPGTGARPDPGTTASARTPLVPAPRRASAPGPAPRPRRRSWAWAATHGRRRQGEATATDTPPRVIAAAAEGRLRSAPVRSASDKGAPGSPDPLSASLPLRREREDRLPPRWSRCPRSGPAAGGSLPGPDSWTGARSRRPAAGGAGSRGPGAPGPSPVRPRQASGPVLRHGGEVAPPRPGAATVTPAPGRAAPGPGPETEKR